MNKKSLFIVIEGLDGSGKSTVSKQLVKELDYAGSGSVLLTNEPNELSCGGLFIRDILMKKIPLHTPALLALAFATNRLDHCDRLIKPWLEKKEGNIVISDRYYLSSLVYQSDDKTPLEKVMLYNEYAIKPDIIFFINVDNKVCYERMKHRNQPEELFESNLSKYRKKYFEAIAFLRTHHHENIVEINGNGSIEDVVNNIKSEIWTYAPFLKPLAVK